MVDGSTLFIHEKIHMNSYLRNSTCTGNNSCEQQEMSQIKAGQVGKNNTQLYTPPFRRSNQLPWSGQLDSKVPGRAKIYELDVGYLELLKIIHS